ncbi:hypothetical protein [Streptomyces hydrogenans]|uniref:hypothetical protein n=1 Tax=Streptomyces hydrogenans TaxID=1873719 RepID=UPI0035E3111B
MARIEVTDEVIAAAQGGDRDAVWQIVCAYGGVLEAAVRTVAPAATADQFDDLLQEARCTLLQHIKAFDASSSSAQLATFAHRAIRRAVATEWVRMATGLTIEPSAALDVRRAMAQTEGDVEGAWMILGSHADPRRRMSRETFMALLEALSETVSLDSTPGNARGEGSTAEPASLAETIPDPDGDFTDPTERRDLARYLLDSIGKRQSLALRAFYGIGMTATDDHETALDMQTTPAIVRSHRRHGITSCRRVASAAGFTVAA